MRLIVTLSILFALATIHGRTREEAVERSMLQVGIARRGEVQAQSGSLKNVVFVEKPELCSPNAEGILFKLDPDERFATQVRVQFGEIAGSLIEVRTGLQPGDKVFLSDTSAWMSKRRLRLQR